jgi:hypothetical protein
VPLTDFPKLMEHITTFSVVLGWNGVKEVDSGIGAWMHLMSRERMDARNDRVRNDSALRGVFFSLAA